MAESNPFAPYVNKPNENDPMIKKVPMDQMGIASNSAAMPKGMMMGDKPPGIQHVGNSKR